MESNGPKSHLFEPDELDRMFQRESTCSTRYTFQIPYPQHVLHCLPNQDRSSCELSMVVSYSKWLLKNILLFEHLLVPNSIVMGAETFQLASLEQNALLVNTKYRDQYQTTTQKNLCAHKLETHCSSM